MADRPKTLVTVNMEFEHPDWAGDGQDEQILLQNIRAVIEKHLKPKTLEIDAESSHSGLLSISKELR